MAKLLRIRYGGIRSIRIVHDENQVTRSLRDSIPYKWW
jgi:hypothetical protein